MENRLVNRSFALRLIVSHVMMNGAQQVFGCQFSKRWIVNLPFHNPQSTSPDALLSSKSETPDGPVVVCYRKVDSC